MKGEIKVMSMNPNEMIRYQCKYCGVKKMRRRSQGKPIPDGYCLHNKDASGKPKKHIYTRIY